MIFSLRLSEALARNGLLPEVVVPVQDSDEEGPLPPSSSSEEEEEAIIPYWPAQEAIYYPTEDYDYQEPEQQERQVIPMFQDYDEMTNDVRKVMKRGGGGGPQQQDDSG